MPETTKKTAVKAKKTAKAQMISDPYEWLAKQTDVKTSADIEVPDNLIDQVIGQDAAVAAAQKAAAQGRNLLLIGDPGTGKSMIAKAMSQMLPKRQLDDVLTYHNDKDPNAPKILLTEAGEGRKVQRMMRRRARRKKIVSKVIEWALVLVILGIGGYLFWKDPQGNFMGFMISILVAAFLFTVFRQRKDPVSFAVPSILLEHDPKSDSHASYVDATGSHAGALLGDVRHDPYQSGGLETPTHERVEIGAIHKAHKGILFVDEINVLRLDSQQALLTAMQDGVYSIVGQSDNSSGAMVKTDPVPCQFILVAAGNLDAVQAPDGAHTGMHPALRSRIRGYGYEVYVNATFPDNHDNRIKLCRFVAQEIQKDGRISHFNGEAIAEVILEGQRRSGRRGKLTLRLRELGGLVRTAGDIANTEGAKVVTAEHVREAKRLSRSLEQQIAEAVLESRREHQSSRAGGELIGVAPGAGTVGTGEVGEPAGLVVPIATAVTPPISRHGGHIAFGGGIEVSAKTQTETVRALLQTIAGATIADKDLHVQSVVPQDGVEAEGAGLALAVSALSALEGIPIRQDTVLISGITVTGELTAVTGLTQAIEAAVDAGFSRAIVSKANQNDVQLNPVYKAKVQVFYADTMVEALAETMVGRQAPATIKRLAALKGLATSNGMVTVKPKVR